MVRILYMANDLVKIALFETTAMDVNSVRYAGKPSLVGAVPSGSNISVVGDAVSGDEAGAIQIGGRWNRAHGKSGCPQWHSLARWRGSRGDLRHRGACQNQQHQSVFHLLSPPEPMGDLCDPINKRQTCPDGTISLLL